MTYEQMGVNINRPYFKLLQFADDIFLESKKILGWFTKVAKWPKQIKSLWVEMKSHLKMEMKQMIFWY